MVHHNSQLRVFLLSIVSPIPQCLSPCAAVPMAMVADAPSHATPHSLHPLAAASAASSSTRGQRSPLGNGATSPDTPLSFPVDDNEESRTMTKTAVQEEVRSALPTPIRFTLQFRFALAVNVFAFRLSAVGVAATRRRSHLSLFSDTKPQRDWGLCSS